jgi:LysM repeat protein
MALPLHKINLLSEKPRISVTCLLGKDPPEISGGYGGWEEIARPRRTSLTQWNGHPPFRLRLPLVIDSFADGDSIEEKCERLHSMGRSPESLTPPPIIDIEGAVMFSGIGWVIDDISWGACERHHTRGYRTRQEVVVQLLQHIPKDKVVRHQTNQPKYRIYTIKKGDTLQKIAAKLLKDKSRWKEIAKINNIRDPKHLKVGRKIKVPRK